MAVRTFGWSVRKVVAGRGRCSLRQEDLRKIGPLHRRRLSGRRTLEAVSCHTRRGANRDPEGTPCIPHLNESVQALTSGWTVTVDAVRAGSRMRQGSSVGASPRGDSRRHPGAPMIASPRRRSKARKSIARGSAAATCNHNENNIYGTEAAHTMMWPIGQAVIKQMDPALSGRRHGRD